MRPHANAAGPLVICTGREVMRWPDDDIENLRVALNALLRLFRL